MGRDPVDRRDHQGLLATKSGLLGLTLTKGDSRIVESGESCRSYEIPDNRSSDVSSEVRYVASGSRASNLGRDMSRSDVHHEMKEMFGTVITSVYRTMRGQMIMHGAVMAGLERRVVCQWRR